MLRRVLLGVILAPVAAAVAPPATASATAPVVSYTILGTPGDNGWYRSAVTVAWTVNFMGLQPIATTGCEPAAAVAADTPGITLTCQASNTDGVTTSRTRLIRIDQTPPDITGVAPARAPEPTGWYRSPVGVTWSGSDSMSGIAGCTSVNYTGPDGPATLAGTCTDGAGNTSAPVPFALRYDATAPGLAGVVAAGGDTVATVSWQASADVASVTITRTPGRAGPAPSPVFQGTGASRFEDSGLPNGQTLAYTVTATDPAGNTSTVTALARTASRLRTPRAGAQVAAIPTLRWKSVDRATYYNVQLYRGSRKILSSWPSRARLRLQRTWRYGGKRYRLGAGTYRWYVWAGYGNRAQRKYGRLLGTRRFVIRKLPAR